MATREERIVQAVEGTVAFARNATLEFCPDRQLIQNTLKHALMGLLQEGPHVIAVGGVAAICEAWLVANLRAQPDATLESVEASVQKSKDGYYDSFVQDLKNDVDAAEAEYQAKVAEHPVDFNI